MSPESPEFQALAAALNGQYVLEQEIGRGGMGVVYRARDSRLDRLVAIKTLLPHLAGDSLVRERFIREARTAAALSHPGIVPIHRADEINGRVFFVMGLVPGESLAHLLRQRGRLGVAQALSVLRDVSLSLSYAHARGVVHRDVKAENILLDASSGRAVVTDFGIARLAEAAPLTATGHVLGTVHYMSPEGVSGEAVDARSDLYALGVVAWLAIAGQFPYDNPTASAVLLAHVTRPVPSLRVVAPWVGEDVAAIVERCLAKDPAARFSSCNTLAAALEEVLATLPNDDETPDEAIDDDAERYRSQVVSETEAQRIWTRAAQMQADTTSQPAPLLPQLTPVSRQAEPAPVLTSGFRLGDVRAAAVEAGIPAAYVERALAERGLVTSPATQPEVTEVREGPLMIRSRSPWAGSPRKIEYEAEVEGEMSQDELEEFIEEIRRTVGEVGQVGLVGRSLTFTSGNQQQRRLQITVTSRWGKTTIRAFEDLTPITGAIFGGIMGGGGGGVGGAMMGIVMGVTQNPAIAMPTWLGAVAASYGVARFAYGRSFKKRSGELKYLVERLVQLPRRLRPPDKVEPKKLR